MYFISYRLRFLFLVILTAFNFSTQAQTVQLLDQNLRPTSDSSQAVFFAKTIKNPTSAEAVVRTYYLDGLKFLEEQFSNLEKRIYNGVNKSWHPNGQVKMEISYKENLLHGMLKTFYPSGQLRREELYSEGKLVEGKCFSKAGADTTYYDFQVKPRFPGGERGLMEFLSKNLRSQPKTNNAEGIVVVQFVVSPEGKVTNITFLKSISPWHDQEVLRILSKMPDWRPGRQENEYYPTKFTLPIRYNRF